MPLRFLSSRLLLTLLLGGAGTLPLAAADNVLTSAERAAGWQLLFDGTTLQGWRGYRLPGLPKAGWEVTEGTIHVLPKVKGSDLITEKSFTNFDLTWEWKIAEAGNNGVKYFVTEARPKSPGHEYQMLDDAKHPDGKIGPHRQTASFYDVLPPAPNKPTRPPGEWNQSRILVQGDRVEHWLNGQRVLAYQLGSPEVKAGIARSKFKQEAGFGDKVTGPIMLTYHEDECWFRNVKLRELP